ncbi:hypothetical protein [Glutamicibacter sp. NPDC090743]|uniref:hypothetical protein n=1 Tax=Glutamicibacter sp. NPDC090743 TaxID=3364001 RepID=UPI00382AFF18
MEKRKPAMDLSALGGLKKIAQPVAPRTEETVTPSEPGKPTAANLEETAVLQISNSDVAAVEDAAAVPEAEDSPEKAIASEPERPAPAPLDDVDPAMEATAPLTFSLPEDLVRKVRKFNKEKKISYPNIVLNAIDATYDKLPSLLEPEHFQVPTRNLFQRPNVIPTTTARDGSTRKEPMTMRMKKRYIAVLDQIAAELTDKNRTKLVETALKEYLKKEK